MPRLQSLVSVLLLSRSLIPAVSAVATEVSEIVTCATSTPNPFSNPSFEDGITGWGFASGTTGSVVSGDAADGSSYMETTATSTSVTVLLYQRSSDFITNGHYAASFQYRIKPSSSQASMTCYIKAYMDSFTSAGLLGSASQAVSSSIVGWTTLSFDYTPTTSGTHTFEIYGYCTGTTGHTGAAIDIDNVEFVGPPVTLCSTQTITLTSTSTTTTTTASTETSSTQVLSSSSIVSPPVSLHTPSPVIPVVSPSSSLAASSSAITSISSSSAAISPKTHRLSTPVIPASSSVATTSPSSSIPMATISSSGTASITISTITTTTTTAMTTSSMDADTTLTSSRSTTLAPTTLPSQATETEGRSTTSTVLSTRTATITACPSTVTNCPASEQTTFVTTETVVVSTTICPVRSQPTTTIIGDETPDTPASTTSTVFTTRIATITACPSTVQDCPARAKTTFVTTETLVVSTIICPVTATQTPAGTGIHSTAGSNANYYGSDAAAENWTVGGTSAPSSSSRSSSATGARSVTGSATATTPSSTSGSSSAVDSVGATGGVLPESGNHNASGTESSEQESATFTRTRFETQYGSSTPAVPVPSSTTPGVPGVSIVPSAPDALFTGAAPVSAVRITYGQLVGSLAGWLLSAMLVMLA
ncbi:hypothetical protein ASPCAL04988 [Aspergillus calidoustus]|uniref:CBM-cenC domain-containing protein n=1 Tax=Aspergillus calidoustus TaxID=454130 RepID=A0A0U5G071_ASPCI|nr:hypothetical protein ASPCAL04988 [Aspergillus calidoustus]